MADGLSEIIRAYHEVTERLQSSHETLQAEVQRLREQLASKDAQLERSRRLSALGQMAAGIAHEIRNPLAAIQLYVGMVVDDLQRSEASPDVALENTRKIASAVIGLNAIVVDVLNFSREIDLNHQVLDVGELIDRVIETHRPAIEAQGIKVCRFINEDAVVYGDANLLHQALVNLVRNAVEAMENLSIRPELRLDATVSGSTLRLQVRDVGPGIARKKIDQIFNPFFTTRSTGTGLGLAIVHRIIDAHDGRIAVRNDGGAVFTIWLPAQQPEPDSGASRIRNNLGGIHTNEHVLEEAVA